MKFVMATVLTLFAAGFAQASTVCNVNSASSKKEPMTFDRILFRGEVNSTKYILVEKGGESVVDQDFDAYKPRSFEEWREFDGMSLVAFGRQDDGRQTIAIAQIKASAAAPSENIMQTLGMAVGPLYRQQLLNLLMVQSNLSVFCSKVK